MRGVDETPPSTTEAGYKWRMYALHEFVVVIARGRKIDGGMMHPCRIQRCPGERNQEAQAQVSSACI